LGGQKFRLVEEEAAMTTSATRVAILDEMITESQTRIADLRSKVAIEEGILAELHRKRQAQASDYASVSGDNGSPNAKKNPAWPVVVGPERVEEGRVPQHIVAVLREAKTALSTDEITRRVQERGATSTAKKGLAAVVASALTRRDDLFVRIGKGMYDLCERQGAKENASGR
jgi:hypothetical protein